MALSGVSRGLSQKYPAFAEALWDLEELPRQVSSSGSASRNVTCTVYEIGGGLTNVLSKTCSKELPLIPHVGVRLGDREYFYSDRVESRPNDVMKSMLGSFPQLTFDLGSPKMTVDELETWLESPQIQKDWCADTYNVFDHNCNHFARLLSETIASEPLPPHIIEPVLSVTEDMLSELPQWRRDLGLNLMNQITRLVVVSWGRATKQQAQQQAVPR